MEQKQLQKTLQEISPNCALTEEQMEHIQKAIEIATEAITEVAKIIAKVRQRICEAILPAIAEVVGKIGQYYEAALSVYPSRRVVWLALHHKRERVRKKNKACILRWLFRKGRCLQ